MSKSYMRKNLEKIKRVLYLYKPPSKVGELTKIGLDFGEKVATKIGLTSVDDISLKLYSDLTKKFKEIYKDFDISHRIVLQKGQKSIEYIVKNLNQNKKYISSQVKRMSESELISYWREFIKGIPEYNELVRSGKIKEISKIVETLDIHEKSIRALKTVMEQINKEGEEKKSFSEKDTQIQNLENSHNKPFPKSEKQDLPLYAALFTEGHFQHWIDKTAGAYLHELIGKGAESNIIDSVCGLGHRLKAGHDLSGFVKMFGQGGLDGAAKWFQHMFSDLMSPDGIPLPGASHLYKFLENAIGVSEKWFIDWTCISATDIVSAGLSLLILAKMHKIESEEKKILKLTGLTFVQISLLIFAEANPFYIATVPLQVLLMRYEWKKWQLKKIQQKLKQLDEIHQNALQTLHSIN